MLKKIVLGGLLVGLIGFLVVGAVVRTNAVAGSGEASNRHSATTVEAYANGNGGGQGGRWADQDATALQSSKGESDLAVRGGNGVSNGNGGGRGGNGGNSGETASVLGEPLADVQPDDWTSYAGTVVSTDADLVEVETTTGEIIPFEGRPLSYALGQGFTLNMGDAVLLHGFDEDGEFKLGQVDNLVTGASVALRDTAGRPGWAGRGNRG